MNIKDTKLVAHFLHLNECPQIQLTGNESYMFHYSFDNQFNQNLWNYYLGFLPQSFQREVLRYRRWEDRYNCLIGKLMVYCGYYMLYNYKIRFENFIKDSFGKPYIKNSDLNFNISHSGNMVVCVFSKHEIGIDIEEIKDIEFTLFENVFSDTEMVKINDIGLSKFYEYWTKKEAIIKAIGKGMSIPLLEIKIEDNYNSYKNDRWYTRSSKMGNIYCSIASKYRENNIKLIELKF